MGLIDPMAQALAPAAAKQLTARQVSVLLHLRLWPGVSIGETAQALKLSKHIIWQAIEALSAKSMVERRPHPTDKRLVQLHLLPAAQPILADLTHMPLARVA